MTNCLLTCLCLSLGIQFDVKRIDLPHKNAQVTLAKIGTGKGGDILVVDGSTLTMYGGSALSPHPPMTLEKGTTCFDIADVDGDGVSEVIAIAGDRILLHEFPKAGQPATPAKALFEAHTLLATAEKEPVPYVLVVPHEGTLALSLPFENALEMRGLDGTTLMTYPYVPGRGRFVAKKVTPSAIACPEAVEYRVEQYLYAEPALPEPSEKSELMWGKSWGSGEKPEEWSWFPLNASRAKGPCVLYARERDNPNTRIRMATLRDKENEDATETYESIGKEHKYPGSIITASFYSSPKLPDFNADGFTDVILWKAPEMGHTADSLTRAISGGTWEVNVTVHLYDPQGGRYQPAPAMAIDYGVPVSRFLPGFYYGCPLGDCILNDFDGDGRTDFACFAREDRFPIWLCRQNGFSRDPDFDAPFPGHLQGVFFTDLDENGRIAAGLRTDNAFYIVRALD